MKNISIKIDQWWKIPCLNFRIYRYSFAILLTHGLLKNKENRKHFKWFGIDKNRRVHLTTDWDINLIVLGMCFQLQKYRWYMHKKRV